MLRIWPLSIAVASAALISGILANAGVCVASGSVIASVFIVAITGALGGFVNGMAQQTKSTNAIKLMKYGEIELGYVGDMLIGVAAALSIFFVLDTLFDLKTEGIVSSADGTRHAQAVLRLIAVGVISGYAGSPLLNTLGSMLTKRALDKQKDELAASQELKRVEAQLKKSSRVRFLTSVISSCRRWKDFDNARKYVDLALAEDPLLADYHIANCALSLDQGDEARRKSDERTAKQFYQDAMKSISRAVELDTSSARALYNRACCRQRLGEAPEAVITDLKEANQRDPVIATLVDIDPDFKDLKASKPLEFGELRTPQAKAA